MVTSDIRWMRYWKGVKRCQPPRRTSGWKPASPFMAMKPFSTEPLPLMSFSTMPTRVLGM